MSEAPHEVVDTAIARLHLFAAEIEGLWRASSHGLIMAAENCAAKQGSRADRIRIWYYGCREGSCLKKTPETCERDGCAAKDRKLALRDAYRALQKEGPIVVEKKKPKRW